MNERTSYFDVIWVLLPFILLMYVLPWMFNPGTVLSVGAYDFAELLAKRPFDDVGYRAVLALRGQLLLVTALLVVGTPRPLFTGRWWLYSIVCGVLITAQLPPLTYFFQFNDPNQQQQALLAGVSLLVTLVGLSGVLWHRRHVIRVLLSIFGIASVVYSIYYSIDIIRDYALPARIGVGVVGMIITYVLSGLSGLLQMRS
ncbi:MAG: hypothetical protein ACFE0Q_17065 [Anaerolineae bacterium]